MTTVREALLVVEHLGISAASEGAPPVLIVNDISYVLHRGEVLGLIGESGAGKSTIGLAALGYARRGCRLVAGVELFHGADIRQMSADQRRAIRGRGVAYIAQSAAASFNPAMTLMTQVCEVAIRQKHMTPDAARLAAIDLFGALDLPDAQNFGNRYPHQVSGGQLQRAMAAMAMMAQPDILVFDEPTTALDVTTQVEVLAAFRKLIRVNHTAALYITHDLAVVAQIADQIMVLQQGKMVEIGAASQILQEPKADYTKRLVRERAAASPFAAQANAGAPLLSVSHVFASYARGQRVLDDVDFEIMRGDTFAVVGESGSGKSTLARVITGLLPATSGEIRFKGDLLPARLRARSKDQLRRIQMIYQMPDVALNPAQTVLDVIGRPVSFYFNRPAAVVRARVLELLAMMDLDASFLMRATGALSGGQKQRVCIARALAAEPDLIICDEVTSALDQLVGEEILRTLKKLQDELGLAYLFITHDLGIVRRTANKVAVMLKGQIVASGMTGEVFSPPFHPYTQLLLSCVPEMRADWLDDVLAARETL